MSGTWTRRAVLAAAGGASTVALAPTASARLTRRMVVPRAKDFAGSEGYDGYFVHVGGVSVNSVDPQRLSGCELSNWPPGGIQAFNGTLIDRIEKDHDQVPTQVYTAKSADISRGSLWVVNRVRNCPGDYVGFEVEQVGAAVGNVSADTETTGTAGTDANPIGQPGFGLIAGVAGTLAGAAALARRHWTDE